MMERIKTKLEQLKDLDAQREIIRLDKQKAIDVEFDPVGPDNLQSFAPGVWTAKWCLPVPGVDHAAEE